MVIITNSVTKVQNVITGIN